MTKQYCESRAAGAAARAPLHLLARAAEAHRPRAPHPAAALSVLHVDGDAEVALMLGTLLAPEARLVHVDTLAAASRAIGTQQFALVVLDPDLPDGEGGALLAALAARRAATPLLLYARRLPAWRMQAAACLHKERTTPRQLWQALERLLVSAAPRP